jgi:uncharacterized GH25 family protein
MSLRKPVRDGLVALLIVGCWTSTGEAAGVDWLSGSGDELKLRLRGEVCGADGLPAEQIQVTAGGTSINPFGSKFGLSPTVANHRFEVWIPVNKLQPQHIWVKAAKVDGSQAAYLLLHERELRQSAIDGITLRLQPPARYMDVQVAFDGKPVVGAHVKADLGSGIDQRARTDDTGIARFALQSQLSPISLTGWTDDFRLGGFYFDRKPVRDPKADRQIVELSQCRDQRFRFVDQDGTPVPNVEIILQMATPSPNVNFVGTNEHLQMRTDTAGETTCKWFPDWKEHYFYVDLRSREWVPEREHQLIDGVVVFKLKRTRIRDRKPVVGRVVSTSTGVEGFHVTMQSPQGESAHSSDWLSAVVDAEGRFSLDVLPDATYCCFVSDSRWVSDSIDLIPFQSASAQATEPELTVSEGQLVDVQATVGPHRRPYPNLVISFVREHRFSWLQDGEIQYGVGGPIWGQKTDLSGHTTIRVLPGVLKVTGFTPSWRDQQKIEIRAGEPARIHLHREFDEKRTITGRLVAAEGVEAELSGAEIQVGSVDGNYDDERQAFKCSDDGTFSFEMMAGQIGIFARTRDGNAAGALIVRSRDTTEAKITLLPTMKFSGQVVDDEGRPIAGHQVSASVLVDANRTSCTQFATSFEAQRIETVTDEVGNFTFTHLPAKLDVFIAAAALENPDNEQILGQISLEPVQARARETFRLSDTPVERGPVTLNERYQSLLRDCSLASYHLIVIIPGAGQSAGTFMEQHLQDTGRNRDLYAFMPLVVPTVEAANESADDLFLKDHNWSRPEENCVFVCAIDSQGRELARATFDVEKASEGDEAAEFIHLNAPPQRDAEQKWREAFAEAHRTGRRVWARASQRYCAPCFRMSRWLDDQQDLVSKDYVLLKIDQIRDFNGDQVSQRLTSGEEQGVPFHAIFEADGRMLIDSAGQLGNIGCPAGTEGKNHLRKMLLSTRRNLADHEVDQLVNSVGD